MTQPGRTRKQGEPRSLRTVVLEAVHELVQRDGWAASSIGRIAQLAGVSRPTLYKEFGSRRSLAHAYVMFRLDRLMADVDELFAAAADTESGLRSGLMLFFETFDSSIVETVAANGAEVEDLIPIIKETNELATERLASLLGRWSPSIGEHDAVIHADTIARLALTHALAPTITRQEAIDRITHVALRLLPTP